ncbi:MAG: O-antigen ligase family protein [Gemmatimonadetes bacterium]|nr:O-antigen ligase family protein [Gemmatimonadota bacterium]
MTVPFALYPGLAFLTPATTPVLAQVAIVLATLVTAPTSTNLRILERFWAYGTAAHLAGMVALGVAVDGRVFTTTGYDPNDYAAMAAMVFPLCMGLVQREKGFWKAIALGCAVVLVLGVVKTGSRGGTLALVAGALFYVLAARGARKALSIALFVFGGMAAWAVAPPSYKQRMYALVEGEQDYNYTDYGGRKQIWARSRIYIARHPVAGVGIGNFPIIEGQYLEERGKVGKWSTAHNSYYQAGVELGIFGGLLLMVQILVSYRRGWRLRRASIGDEPAGTGSHPELGAAFAAFTCSSVFLSHAYFPYFFGLMSLVAMAERVAAASPQESIQGATASLPMAGSRSRSSLRPVSMPAPLPVPPIADGRGGRATAGGWRSRAGWPGQRGRFAP